MAAVSEHLSSETLEAWAKGQEPAAEEQQHAGACAQCSRSLRELRKYFAEMKSLQPVPAPPGFSTRAKTRTEKEKPVPRRKNFFTALFLPWKIKVPLELGGAGLAALLLIWAWPRSAGIPATHLEAEENSRRPPVLKMSPTQPAESISPNPSTPATNPRTNTQSEGLPPVSGDSKPRSAAVTPTLPPAMPEPPKPPVPEDLAVETEVATEPESASELEDLAPIDEGEEMSDEPLAMIEEKETKANLAPSAPAKSAISPESVQQILRTRLWAKRKAESRAQAKGGTGADFTPRQDSLLRALGFRAVIHNQQLSYAVRISKTGVDGLVERLKRNAFNNPHKLNALTGTPDSIEIEIR